MESIDPLEAVAENEDTGFDDMEIEGEVPFVEVVDGERDIDGVNTADIVSDADADGLSVPVDVPLALDVEDGEGEFVEVLDVDDVTETE